MKNLKKYFIKSCLQSIIRIKKIYNYNKNPTRK